MDRVCASSASKSGGEVRHYVEGYAMKVGFRPQKMTKPERHMEAILKEAGLPYKFVGGNRLQVGNKYPDFVHKEGGKKLIEVYGDYWHRGQNPQDRIDYFEKHGYACIVIWEKELKEQPEDVLEWIIEFDEDIEYNKA